MIHILGRTEATEMAREKVQMSDLIDFKVLL